MTEKLTELEWEILNAAADDAENLEQIYRAVCFEFVADSGLWRDRETAVPLAELADSVRALTERNLLSVRHDPANPPPVGDLSYIWKSWFEPTSTGRNLWKAHFSSFPSSSLGTHPPRELPLRTTTGQPPNGNTATKASARHFDFCPAVESEQGALFILHSFLVFSVSPCLRGLIAVLTTSPITE